MSELRAGTDFAWKNLSSKTAGQTEGGYVGQASRLRAKD